MSSAALPSEPCMTMRISRADNNDFSGPTSPFNVRGYTSTIAMTLQSQQFLLARGNAQLVEL